MYVHTYICIYICIYIYVYIMTYVYMYMYICVYVRISMYIYIYNYISVYLCMSMYICVYLCMFKYFRMLAPLPTSYMPNHAGMETSVTPALFLCKFHDTSEHSKGLIHCQVAQHLVDPTAASNAPQRCHETRWVEQFTATLQEIVWGGPRLNITVPMCSTCWIKSFKTVFI